MKRRREAAELQGMTESDEILFNEFATQDTSFQCSYLKPRVVSVMNESGLCELRQHVMRDVNVLWHNSISS
jgi:hypothetical protein